MRPDDLPVVMPRWATRRLSAGEVVQLWPADPVPGLNPDDPRVQSIQRCTVGNMARSVFADARRLGYLFVNRSHLRNDSEDAERLARIAAAEGVPIEEVEVAGGFGLCG